MSKKEKDLDKALKEAVDGVSAVSSRLAVIVLGAIASTASAISKKLD